MPADTREDSSLPVMVHIHGGGFAVGSGNGDGTLLASTGNEVIVSMNYRLGIFGFLANKALGSDSGDYGLQDQQFALHWVRQNIAAFGGDPSNLTIYGESAGASSVCDQIASPTAAGLFSKGHHRQRRVQRPDWCSRWPRSSGLQVCSAELAGGDGDRI